MSLEEMKICKYRLLILVRVKIAIASKGNIMYQTIYPNRTPNK